MKSKTFSQFVALSAFSTLWAFTASAQNPVTLSGNLDPIYSVKISPTDLNGIATGISGIDNMTSITVDINSIYSENDIPAFNAASQEVSRVLVEAAKNLVDMRAIVYKLGIDLQRDTQQRFTTQIYQAYQEHFQRRYKSLLALFLGNEAPGSNQSFNEQMSHAMEMCYTTSCLQDIADAQLDLVEFGQAINGRIDLESTTVWEGGGKGFRSKIVKDTIRKTMDEVLATNKKDSLYVKLLRVAAAPFVAAANAVSSAASEFGRFISSPTLSKYKIVADGYNKKSKEWKRIEDAFNNRVGENYKKIISDGNGAKAYVAPAVVQSAPATDNGIPSNSGPTVNFLVGLNARIASLSSSVSVDEQMIRSLLIGEFMQGKADDQALTILSEILIKAFDSGMTLNPKNMLFNGPIPFIQKSQTFYGNAYGNDVSYFNGWSTQTVASEKIKEPKGANIQRFVIDNNVIWAVGLTIPNVSNHVLYVYTDVSKMIQKNSRVSETISFVSGIAKSN